MEHTVSLCPQCGADLSTPCRRKAHEIGGVACRLLAAMKKIEELQRALMDLSKKNMELELEVKRLTSKLHESLEG